MDILKVILTLVPFVWIVGMIPFVNKVYPIICGLPFLAFWLFAGIFVAFGCLKIVYKIDSRKDTEL
ncbi:DUF3311 domain-containing protein [Sporomusa aerivorans]|uniref:DUF3311 domain-containing protein n=1 Tax=Sporomusa aerivorans TaxID=204936 RepID=UPI003529E0B8